MSYASWIDQDIQTDSQQRQCAACGRHELLDVYSLCTGCREDWDNEMDAILDDHRGEPTAQNLPRGYTRP